MTVRFALGPLVSGLLAQWAPWPRIVPYLPHIVLTVVVLIILRSARRQWLAESDVRST